jgi:hypothetical protein
MQEEAVASRINMEKTKATANKQADLVTSEIAVKVATQKKTETIINAEAAADAKVLEGKGEGEKLAAIGKGEADKISAIGTAQAEAYEKQKNAMGQSNVAIIEVTKLLADALKDGKVKIMPEILITGGGNAADGLMAKLSNSLLGVNFGNLLKAKVGANGYDDVKKEANVVNARESKVPPAFEGKK